MLNHVPLKLGLAVNPDPLETAKSFVLSIEEGANGTLLTHIATSFVYSGSKWRNSTIDLGHFSSRCSGFQ